jgi:hypothetical protein
MSERTRSRISKLWSGISIALALGFLAAAALTNVPVYAVAATFMGLIYAVGRALGLRAAPVATQAPEHRGIASRILPRTLAGWAIGGAVLCAIVLVRVLQ